MKIYSYHGERIVKRKPADKTDEAILSILQKKTVMTSGEIYNQYSSSHERSLRGHLQMLEKKGKITRTMIRGKSGCGRTCEIRLVL